MPLEFQPFSTFLSSVQDVVAPEDLAENLVSPFRHWVSAALADVQLVIPWYRSFNLQVVTKEDVSEFCNVSIFQGPVGKVTQLFAYKPETQCTKLYYKRVQPSALDCWMERQRCLCPASSAPDIGANCCSLSGAGEPEGVVAADPGATYYDTSGFGFWVKSSGTGTTGWVALIT